jgi:predicted dehydrogenase
VTDVTTEPIRWGILATGKIAHTFAEDLALVPDARLAAVGSRSFDRAHEFAEDYVETFPGTGPVRAHGSYEELVADPEVDVVYIASPHGNHLDDARLALEAGKHVLCEKALTLTVSDAEEMVRIAAEHDRFLMEAMWTACHPGIRALLRRLAAGQFGTPRHVHAELGFRVDADPGSRMFDPLLGGGALLDMGIYPLTFAHLVLGEARELSAAMDVRDHPNGKFDMNVSMVGAYDGGATATMHASMDSWSSRAASIATDLGRIELTDFHHPTHITYIPYAVGSTNDDTVLNEVVEIVADEPVIGRGYGNEIVEVHRCLREGLRESPLVPHAQTLTLLRQMETMLHANGIAYRSAH